jgi:hypothetical protein
MKLLLLAALFGIASSGQTRAPTSSTCIQTAEVKPDDPFQYTMAVLDSLSYARSAFRPTTLSADATAFTQVTDLMFRIKAADLDYGCAAALLRGYQKSKEPLIFLNSMNTVMIYESVIDLDRKTVEFMKTMVSGGLEKVPAGDLAEKVADLQVRKSELWDGILLILPGITLPLVSKVADSEGHMSSLRITTRQRKTIIQKLEDGFGPSVKDDPVKDGQDVIFTTAANFYHWIADQAWKTTDSK